MYHYVAYRVQHGFPCSRLARIVKLQYLKQSIGKTAVSCVFSTFDVAPNTFAAAPCRLRSVTRRPRAASDGGVADAGPLELAISPLGPPAVPLATSSPLCTGARLAFSSYQNCNTYMVSRCGCSLVGSRWRWTRLVCSRCANNLKKTSFPKKSVSTQI